MRKRWMILWMICCIFGISLCGGKAVYAAGAALAFSKDKENVSVGQSFVVTLTVESMTEFKDFQTYVAYDPQMLELIDTGNHVTGSDGLVFISDIDGKVSNVHQYRMRFRALEEGASEIYVSDTVYIYEAATATEMSVSKGTLQVNVEPKEKVEENKGLGALNLGEGVLEPQFDSKVTEYHVNVSANTEILFMDAKPKLKAYTVTIEGNTNLKEGDNTAKIIVTDKNGTDKIYTILIHKKTKEEEVLEEEEQESETEEEKEEENRIIVYKEDEGIILRTNMYFRIVPIPESSVIPKGYKEESIKLHGTSITVYMPMDDSAGDLVLIYGKAEGNEEEAAFYTYDRMEETLQRFRESEPIVESSTETENYQKQIKYLYIFIFVLVMCLLVMLLALLHIYIKTGQQMEMEQEEEEEEDELWM